ncbi:MAG TPA: hypothetical protein VN517_13065 [Terriglobales bacterium]|jgi:hypothetical protein|nr:hypothetical protein [Terriglobales bacterium]
MRKRTGFLLSSIGIGVIGWLWLRRARRANQVREIHVTAEDLDYQDLSPEELTSSHLIDLNDSTADQLKDLNLAPESVERVIENRPYRSKLELVSRMVLTEAEYESIRENIAVAEGREPVKIA